MNNEAKRSYIGDGVYVSFDGWQFELNVDRDGRIERIFLEPSVFDALIQYRARTYRDANRAVLCETFNPRDRVRYVPGHAHGELNHPDCEDGTVSSQNGHSVFVKFDKSVARLGWDFATSQSCDPNDLVKL